MPQVPVEQVRTKMLPVMFQSFSIAIKQVNENILLAALRHIAADLSPYSRGLLGHFPEEQMNLLECLLQQYDQLPWNELINPLWSV